MKKAWPVIKNVIVGLVICVAVCMMIFTIVSVSTFNQSDRNIFGYKAFIVLSDSMSATDFKAGDLILLKEVEPVELKEGDIIAYTSRNQSTYGKTVAHKIRSLTTDEDGNPGFITYGTSTGVDDEEIVPYSDVVGRYELNLPKVGKLFRFLKTLPGYIALILIPFLVLIVLQGISCVKLFQKYREEQMAEIVKQREKLQKEMEESRNVLEELQALRAELGIVDDSNSREG